jgi:Domain of unknown function (DUF4389)
MVEHPVRLVVEDDLARKRLTVFFRLLLAIPLLIWALLWSVGVIIASIFNWVATLVRGTPPERLHGFMCSYIRYLSHVNAYLWLVAEPYPGFGGVEGTYPVDVTLPPPSAQPRWQTLLRFVLALPALLVSTALGGAGPSGRFARGGGSSSYGGSYGGGGALALTVAVLGWFASLARGRMPKGLRDAGAYSVGYNAQSLAFFLLVTDRYPNADPTALLEGVERPPPHPVHLVGDPDDLRRSRVTVLFRLLLVVPHIVWLALWGIAAVFAAIANWFVTLVRGTPAASLHRFLSSFVRYELHVYAFLYLVGNPFPGFTGAYGSYPLDLELPGPGRQNRWKTAFRLVLAIPALIVNGALGWALAASAFLTWFVALARGTAPWGLRNLSAYALRYSAQTSAYLALLTDVYPHASPLEGASPQLELDLEA